MVTVEKSLDRWSLQHLVLGGLLFRGKLISLRDSIRLNLIKVVNSRLRLVRSVDLLVKEGLPVEVP